MSVCAFAAGNSITAQEVTTNSGKPARLVVNRSANFGVDESVDLLVDGKTVAVLAYNQSYDAPLSAGKHVLSISTNPKAYPQALKPQPLTLTVEPGKTYTFTAVWPDTERAGLVAN